MVEQQLRTNFSEQFQSFLLEIDKIWIVFQRRSSNFWLNGRHQGYFHFHCGTRSFVDTRGFVYKQIELGGRDFKSFLCIYSLAVCIV